MKESTWWLVQFLTGLLLVLLLGSHMGVMHLGDLFAFVWRPAEGGEAIAWASVLGRGRQLGFFVIYVGFLFVALLHGLYGLRNVLIEALAKWKLDRPIGWLLAAAGAGLFAYGAWATWMTFVFDAAAAAK